MLIEVVEFILKIIFSAIIAFVVGMCLIIPVGIANDRTSKRYIIFSFIVGIVIAVAMWPEL